MTVNLPHANGLEPAPPSHPSGLARMVRPGVPGAGTVVCVHGSLDRSGSFARLARRIDGPSIIAYDRRAYQGSRSLPARPELDVHVDDLLEIVAGVAGDGPVKVVGHSFGGVVALAAALRAPDGIDFLVLYEPPMPWLSDEPNPFRGTPPTGPPAAEVEAFFRRMVSDEAWDRLSEHDRAERIADGEALVADLTIIRMATPFSFDQLRGLAVPLTIGIGSKSLSSPSVKVAREVVDLVPSGRIDIIEGAGHGAHLSHPGRLAELVPNRTA